MSLCDCEGGLLLNQTQLSIRTNLSYYITVCMVYVLSVRLCVDTCVCETKLSTTLCPSQHLSLDNTIHIIVHNIIIIGLPCCQEGGGWSGFGD